MEKNELMNSEADHRIGTYRQPSSSHQPPNQHHMPYEYQRQPERTLAAIRNAGHEPGPEDTAPVSLG